MPAGMFQYTINSKNAKLFHFFQFTAKCRLLNQDIIKYNGFILKSLKLETFEILVLAQIVCFVNSKTRIYNTLNINIFFNFLYSFMKLNDRF